MSHTYHKDAEGFYRVRDEPMTTNGHGKWPCKRCTQPQPIPKSHPSVLYCDPCRPLAKREQTAAYQKAHLGQYRNARPDLAMERRRP